MSIKIVNTYRKGKKMEEQLDIFEIEEMLKTENSLTPRQWKLYNFIKQSLGFPNQETLLSEYEHFLRNEYDNYKISLEQLQDLSYGYFTDLEYGRHYSNMTSARNLRKDIRELKSDDTIQKIISVNKIAESVEEAEKYLDSKLSKILKELKLYHKEKTKLEKHFQKRLVFNQERDIIIAVKEME